jgi:hypothetical protein
MQVAINAISSGMEQADRSKVPYEIGLLRAMRMRQIIPATGIVANIGSRKNNIVFIIFKWPNGPKLSHGAKDGKRQIPATFYVGAMPRPTAHSPLDASAVLAVIFV